MITSETLFNDLEQIREKSPLVQNITNYVVMNNTANALLSIGASPVMAHAPQEMDDMASIASALVLNIGTLSEHWVTAMKRALMKANERNLPVVLDPVGAGASAYRNATIEALFEAGHPTVIRGNASEILALANTLSKTKGVDSIHSPEAALETARILAESRKAVVVISGPTDYITDGQRVISIENGNELMPRVTGMGCTATALIGAFLAVNANAPEASAHAMGLMGICGEKAAALAKGPGSLQMHFLDELHTFGRETSENLKVMVK